MDTEENEGSGTEGIGRGNRKRCPTCNNFGTLHPLHLCKKCGGGTVRCIIDGCNEPVLWFGYVGEPDIKPGTPARYCHDHYYRTKKDLFREDFKTDFNDGEHGWRQKISNDKFPIEERGF